MLFKERRSRTTTSPITTTNNRNRMSSVVGSVPHPKKTSTLIITLTAFIPEGGASASKL